MAGKGGGDRYDVFDDGMFIVKGALGKREAWVLAAKTAGSTVLPHEHTPDCDDRRNGR